MISSKKIIIIIPAFNEEETIGGVVKEVSVYSDEVIVVDDGSFDNTRIKALEEGAIVVSHDSNQGYDASIEHGLQKAVLRDADIMVTFDADGQHNPENIKRLTELIISNKADVVIGQRQNVSRFMERIFAYYTRLRYGIKDPLCGLKAYSRELYEEIGYFDTIKSIGTQLMIEALSKGFRLKFVPIQVKMRNGRSRFYSLSFVANFKIFKAMIRLIIKTNIGL